jgi:hypothetical protein
VEKQMSRKEIIAVKRIIIRKNGKERVLTNSKVKAAYVNYESDKDFRRIYSDIIIELNK